MAADRRTLPLAVAGAALIAAAGVEAPLLLRDRDARSPEGRTIARLPAVAARSADGYLGAAGCRPCHEQAWTSWRASYHRTMTARPDDGTLLPHGGAPFAEQLPDGSSLAFDGRFLRATAPGGAATTVPIVTGRHRYQVYWLPATRPGQLTAFPWVYLAEEGRFVPRGSVFVAPPGATSAVHWSSNCIQCHTTGFAPREREGRYAPEVSDLGVACEACHGPGAAHAAAYRSPLTRALRRPEEPIAGIRSPAHLSPREGRAVCGRCHALTLPKDEDRWFDRGYAGLEFPGDPLDRARIVLTAREAANHTARPAASFFDGAGRLRVTGREAQALDEAPCATLGDSHTRRPGADRAIACVDCHAMHAEPDPRTGFVEGAHLRPAARGDGACLSCHEDRFAAPAHTGHAAPSPGARCVGCHMPSRTFGLLRPFASHQIERDPRAVVAGTPSACALCHVGKSLDPGGPLLERALRGDGALRALLAGLLGQEQVQATLSPNDPRPREALERLAEDPWDAIRLVAARARPRYGLAPGPDPTPPPARPAAVDATPLILSE